MLNSNKSLHRELPGGANLQLFHCTKYLSLNSYPYVTALSFCTNLLPIPNFKNCYRPHVCPWFLLVCNITPPLPSIKSSSQNINHTANSIYSKSLFVHFNCWGLRIFWSEPTAVLSLSISHTNNFISRTRHHHLHHSRLFFLVIYFITFDTIFRCSHSHNNFINYCQRRTNITTTTVSIICYSAQLAIKHLHYIKIL